LGRLEAGVILLGVLSVPVWERPISDGFWIVVGVTALAALRLGVPKAAGGGGAAP
jgi:hypothetical protein